jgi:hypothetical protein
MRSKMDAVAERIEDSGTLRSSALGTSHYKARGSGQNFVRDGVR